MDLTALLFVANIYNTPKVVACFLLPLFVWVIFPFLQGFLILHLLVFPAAEGVILSLIELYVTA